MACHARAQGKQDLRCRTLRRRRRTRAWCQHRGGRCENVWRLRMPTDRCCGVLSRGERGQHAQRGPERAHWRNPQSFAQHADKRGCAVFERLRVRSEAVRQYWQEPAQ